MRPRGFPVEDTAAMVFQFANGALGTFMLSDTAASPRSWEQTSQENTSYASYPDEDCYHVFGTQGSLSIPTMRLKTYPGTQSWWEPTDDSTIELEVEDPLANQVTHFAAVIRGEAEPICSGQAGVNTLLVCDAVIEAGRSGQIVQTGVAAG
jgi:predicted dehydrogenase